MDSKGNSTSSQNSPSANTWKYFHDETTQYISIFFRPRGDKSFQVHHILPIPPCPILSRKWDYILSQINVSYIDSDNDRVTVGKCSELVDATVDLDIQSTHIQFNINREGTN